MECKTLSSTSSEELVKSRSPWRTPLQPQGPCSLAAVMDEEFAKKLQADEEGSRRWVVATHFMSCIKKKKKKKKKKKVVFGISSRLEDLPHVHAL